MGKRITSFLRVVVSVFSYGFIWLLICAFGVAAIVLMTGSDWLFPGSWKSLSTGVLLLATVIACVATVRWLDVKRAGNSLNAARPADAGLGSLPLADRLGFRAWSLVVGIKSSCPV